MGDLDLLIMGNVVSDTNGNWQQHPVKSVWPTLSKPQQTFQQAKGEPPGSNSVLIIASLHQTPQCCAQIWDLITNACWTSTRLVGVAASAWQCQWPTTGKSGTCIECELTGCTGCPWPHWMSLHYQCVGVAAAATASATQCSEHWVLGHHSQVAFKATIWHMIGCTDAGCTWLFRE